MPERIEVTELDQAVRFVWPTGEPGEYLEATMLPAIPGEEPMLYMRGGTSAGIAVWPSSGNSAWVELRGTRAKQADPLKPLRDALEDAEENVEAAMGNRDRPMAPEEIGPAKATRTALRSVLTLMEGGG